MRSIEVSPSFLRSILPGNHPLEVFCTTSTVSAPHKLPKMGETHLSKSANFVAVIHFANLSIGYRVKTMIFLCATSLSPEAQRNCRSSDTEYRTKRMPLPLVASFRPKSKSKKLYA